MNETNFTHDNQTEGVALLALSGYVLIIRNDEETVFDSLLGTDI